MNKRGSSNPPWMEKPGVFGTAVKYVVIAVVLFLVIYPFWTVIATSFGTQADITRAGGLLLWPTTPSLDAYVAILSGGVVSKALLVSIGVTVIGTVCSLAFTIAMAYGLSRPSMIGHRTILLAVLFTMLFAAGIIPNFLVVKELGLLNSYGSLVVPVLVSAFNLVVMRNFFMGLPAELLDSARIDGAGDLRVLFQIVLPLSKAVIAVVTLFYAVEYWNSFFTAMLYLNNSSEWPLSLVLRAFVLQGEPAAGATGDIGANVPVQSIQMAVIVISIIPILLVYPFLQRYFTKGVLTGAIKG